MHDHESGAHLLDDRWFQAPVLRASTCLTEIRSELEASMKQVLDDHSDDST